MSKCRLKIFNLGFIALLAMSLLCLSFSNALAQAQVVTVIYTPAIPPLSFLFVSPPAAAGVPPPVACMLPTQVGTVLNAFKKTVKDELENAAEAIEQDVKSSQKDYLEQLMADIEGIEVSISKAWNQSWLDMTKPALKKMAKQINVVMMEEARQQQSFFDATLAAEMQQENDIFAVESEREHRPSIHANIAASAAKGFGRVSLFSRAMRKSIPKELIEAGYNIKDADEKSSRLEYENDRYSKYMSYFCDPDSAGSNLADYCTASNDKIYNADIQPNKFLYSRLTLPIDPNTDPDKNMYKALLAMRVNMFGSPVGSIMPKDVLNSPAGKEKFLDKRSFLARYGAVMSVHNLIESWRIPGSQMGDWMQSLLELEVGDIKDWYRNIDNPSYKELMHAMTVDKFNSGRYARDLLSNESDIKMEKLVLTAYQSMLLRDYYELLERTALVLAVQVSMLTDGVDIASDIQSLSTE